MATTIRLVPSAQRLMNSLRDLGYDLPTAVADLVDNSIEASATVVDVDFRFEGEDSWIRIADNGIGMSAAVLDEALRFGTRREYPDSGLSRFGLGMKTASLSQCRSMTVATRADDSEPIEIRRWDLDYVEETDEWEALQLRDSECRSECVAPLREHPGTVVLWEQLDRVLRYRLPTGIAASQGMAALCRQVEEHLAMVFHRFLGGEAKRSLPLALTINGNAVEPWDPFARSESGTVALRRQSIRFQHKGRNSSVSVQPFILPNEAQFSTSRAHALASGPDKWNRQQGFYIYRGDRMVQSGGWNHVRTLDEHTKLARIAVDFSPRLDELFEVNVAKMKVKLPAIVRNELTAIASAVCNQAGSAYRQRPSRPPRRGTGGLVGGAPRPPRAGDSVSGGPHSGAVAEQVVAVVRRELRGEQAALDRVLGALSGISDEFHRAVNHVYEVPA